MDECNENIGYLYIILIGVSVLILVFLFNYYHLYQFKKCYNIDFKESYCKKYKDRKY